MSTESEGPEIEITPEMIEAGESELAAYDPEASRAAGAVIDIFLAMLRASRRKPSLDSDRRSHRGSALGGRGGQRGNRA